MSHLYRAGKLNQLAFLISTGLLSIPDSEAFTCWFKNDSNSLDLVISQCVFCWNGGDTNHNLAVNCKLYDGASVPTANNTAFTLEPLSGHTVAPAPATAYIWDGAAAGMTIADPGAEVAAGVFAQGCTLLPVQDAIIMAPGDVVACSCEGEEAGTGSFLCFMFFVPTGSLV